MPLFRDFWTPFGISLLQPMEVHAQAAHDTYTEQQVECTSHAANHEKIDGLGSH